MLYQFKNVKNAFFKSVKKLQKTYSRTVVLVSYCSLMPTIWLLIPQLPLVPARYPGPIQMLSQVFV